MAVKIKQGGVFVDAAGGADAVAGFIARIVYNAGATQWQTLSGTVYTSVIGPKEWLWGAGDPDPTTLMAENDTVIGNGT